MNLATLETIMRRAFADKQFRNELMGDAARVAYRYGLTAAETAALVIVARHLDVAPLCFPCFWW